MVLVFYVRTIKLEHYKWARAKQTQCNVTQHSYIDSTVCQLHQVALTLMH